MQPLRRYDYATIYATQAFNAVTYMTDHLMGKTQDTRLTSAWYGHNKGLKTKALETALEMADAS